MTEVSAARATIRPAKAEDAEGLARVYVDSAEHHFRLDPSMYRLPDFKDLVRRYRDRLPAPEGSEILVAEQDGIVVGWLEIQIKEAHGEPRMNRDAVAAEIDIAVLDSYRGQGIGSQLIEVAETWAADRGAELITLDTHIANIDAHRFYQDRHGFRTTGLLMMKRVARD